MHFVQVHAQGHGFIGLQKLIPQVDDLPEWNIALGAALLVMRRWFVKGLIEKET